MWAPSEIESTGSSYKVIGPDSPGNTYDPNRIDEGSSETASDISRVSNLDAGIHDLYLRNKLLGILDDMRELASPAELGICRSFLIYGKKGLSDADLQLVKDFLEKVSGSYLATHFNLTPAHVQEMQQAIRTLEKPNITRTAQAKHLRSQLIDRTGMTDEELKFRRRMHLVNPDSAAVADIVDALFRQGVLYTGMSDEEIAAVTLSYIQDNFDYKSDQIKDHWNSVEETIAAGGGDCEDLAILQASVLMLALKRTGQKDSDIREKVTLTAGYVTDRLGLQAGHMVVTLNTGGKTLALDATGRYGAMEFSKLNMQKVMEFNDRLFIAHAPIDAQFATAIEFQLPGDQSDPITSQTIAERIDAIYRALKEISGYAFAVPTLNYGEYFHKLNANGHTGDITHANGDTDADIIRDILNNGLDGYYYYDRSTGKFVEYGDISVTDLTDNSGPDTTLGAYYHLDGQFYTSLLKGTVADNFRRSIYYTYDAETNSFQAIETKDEFDALDGTSTIFQLAYAYVKMGDDYFDEYGDFKDYRFFTLAWDNLTSSGDVDTDSFPDGAPEVGGSAINISVGTITLKEEAFIEYVNQVRNYINYIAMTYHIGNSYLEFIRNEARTIHDQALTEEMKDAVAQNRRSIDKDNGKFVTAMNKFQEKEGQAVVTMAQMLFSYVNATNEAEFTRAEFEIDKFPRVFDNAAGDLIVGIAGELANEIFGIFDYIRAQSKETLMRKKVNVFSENTEAMAEYFHRMTYGQQDPTTGVRVGGVQLWNPDDVDREKVVNPGFLNAQYFGSTVWDVFQSEAEVQYDRGKVSFNEFESQINQMTARIQEIQDLINSSDHLHTETDNFILFSSLGLEADTEKGLGTAKIGRDDQLIYASGSAKLEDADAGVPTDPGNTDMQDSIDSNSGSIEELRTLRTEIDQLKAEIDAGGLSPEELAAKYDELMLKQEEYLNLANGPTQENIDNLRDQLTAYGGPLGELNARIAELEAISPRTAEEEAELQELYADRVAFLTHEDNAPGDGVDGPLEIQANYEQMLADSATLLSLQTTVNTLKNQNPPNYTALNDAYAALTNEQSDLIDALGPLPEDEGDTDVGDAANDFENNEEMDDAPDNPSVDTPDPDAAKGIFLDYNVGKQAVVRRSVLNFQNFIRTALIVKRAEWDRIREAAEGISGKSGTSSSKTTDRIVDQAVETEFNKMSSTFDGFIELTQSFTSAVNDLVMNRIELYKSAWQMTLKITKFVVEIAVSLAASAAGAALGSALAIFGFPPNYWIYAFNTVGIASVEFIYAGLELAVEQSAYSFHNPAIVQLTTSEFNKAQANNFIRELEQDYSDYDEDVLLNPLQIKNDGSTLSHMEKYFRLKTGTYLLDPRARDTGLAGYQESFTYKQGGTLGNVGERTAPDYVEDRGDGYVVYDALKTSHEEMEIIRDHNRIKLFLLILQALYDAVENQMSLMFSSNKTGSIAKFEGQIDSILGYEEALLDNLKDEIKSFVEGIRKTTQYDESVLNAKFSLGKYAAEFGASFLSFIPTHPAGVLAYSAASTVIDLADFIRRRSGPYSRLYTNYRVHPSEVLPGDIMDTLGIDLPEADLGSAAAFEPADESEPDRFDWTDIGYETVMGDINEQYQIDKDTSEEIISSTFAPEIQESLTHRYAPFYHTDKKSIETLRTFYDEAEFNPSTTLGYLAVDFVELIKAQREMNSWFTMRTMFMMIEQALYHAKQNALQSMFSVSSGAQIIQATMSLIDQYNQAQLKTLNDLVEEMTNRFEAHNEFYQAVTDTISESLAIVISAIVFAVAVAKGGASQFKKYEDAIEAAKTARGLAQASSTLLIGVIGLLGVKPFPTAESEILNYEDNAEDSANTDEQKSEQQKSTEKVRGDSGTMQNNSQGTQSTEQSPGQTVSNNLATPQAGAAIGAVVGVGAVAAIGAGVRRARSKSRAKKTQTKENKGTKSKAGVLGGQMAGVFGAAGVGAVSGAAAGGMLSGQNNAQQGNNENFGIDSGSAVKFGSGGRFVFNQGAASKAQERLNRKFRQIQMKTELSMALSEAIADAAEDVSGASASKSFKRISSILNNFKQSETQQLNALVKGITTQVQAMNRSMDAIRESTKKIAGEAIKRAIDKQQKKKEAKLEAADNRMKTGGDSKKKEAELNKLKDTQKKAQKEREKMLKEKGKLEKNLKDKTSINEKADKARVKELKKELNKNNKEMNKRKDDIRSVTHDVEQQKKLEARLGPNVDKEILSREQKDLQRSVRRLGTLKNLTPVLSQFLVDTLTSAMVGDNAYTVAAADRYKKVHEDVDEAKGQVATESGGGDFATADLENAIQSAKIDQGNIGAEKIILQSEREFQKIMASYARGLIKRRFDNFKKEQVEERVKRNTKEKIRQAVLEFMENNPDKKMDPENYLKAIRDKYPKLGGFIEANLASVKFYSAMNRPARFLMGKVFFRNAESEIKSFGQVQRERDVQFELDGFMRQLDNESRQKDLKFASSTSEEQFGTRELSFQQKRELLTQRREIQKLIEMTEAGSEERRKLQDLEADILDTVHGRVNVQDIRVPGLPSPALQTPLETLKKKGLIKHTAIGMTGNPTQIALTDKFYNMSDKKRAEVIKALVADGLSEEHANQLLISLATRGGTQLAAERLGNRVAQVIGGIREDIRKKDPTGARNLMAVQAEKLLELEKELMDLDLDDPTIDQSKNAPVFIISGDEESPSVEELDNRNNGGFNAKSAGKVPVVLTGKDNNNNDIVVILMVESGRFTLEDLKKLPKVKEKLADKQVQMNTVVPLGDTSLDVNGLPKPTNMVNIGTKMNNRDTLIEEMRNSRKALKLATSPEFTRLIESNAKFQSRIKAARLTNKRFNTPSLQTKLSRIIDEEDELESAQKAKIMAGLKEAGLLDESGKLRDDVDVDSERFQQIFAQTLEPEISGTLKDFVIDQFLLDSDLDTLIDALKSEGLVKERMKDGKPVPGSVVLVPGADISDEVLNRVLERSGLIPDRDMDEAVENLKKGLKDRLFSQIDSGDDLVMKAEKFLADPSLDATTRQTIINELIARNAIELNNANNTIKIKDSSLLNETELANIIRTNSLHVTPEQRAAILRDFDKAQVVVLKPEYQRVFDAIKSVFKDEQDIRRFTEELSGKTKTEDAISKQVKELEEALKEVKAEIEGINKHGLEVPKSLTDAVKKLEDELKKIGDKVENAKKTEFNTFSVNDFSSIPVTDTRSARFKLNKNEFLPSNSSKSRFAVVRGLNIIGRGLSEVVNLGNIFESPEAKHELQLAKRQKALQINSVESIMDLRDTLDVYGGKDFLELESQTLVNKFVRASIKDTPRPHKQFSKAGDEPEDDAVKKARKLAVAVEATSKSLYQLLKEDPTGNKAGQQARMVVQGLRAELGDEEAELAVALIFQQFAAFAQDEGQEIFDNLISKVKGTDDENIVTRGLLLSTAKDESLRKGDVTNTKFATNVLFRIASLGLFDYKWNDAKAIRRNLHARGIHERRLIGESQNLLKKLKNAPDIIAFAEDEVLAENTFQRALEDDSVITNLLDRVKMGGKVEMTRDEFEAIVGGDAAKANQLISILSAQDRGDGISVLTTKNGKMTFQLAGQTRQDDIDVLKAIMATVGGDPMFNKDDKAIIQDALLKMMDKQIKSEDRAIEASEGLRRLAAQMGEQKTELITKFPELEPYFETTDAFNSLKMLQLERIVRDPVPTVSASSFVDDIKRSLNIDVTKSLGELQRQAMQRGETKKFNEDMQKLLKELDNRLHQNRMETLEALSKDESLENLGEILEEAIKSGRKADQKLAKDFLQELSRLHSLGNESVKQYTGTILERLKPAIADIELDLLDNQLLAEELRKITLLQPNLNEINTLDRQIADESRVKREKEIALQNFARTLQSEEDKQKLKELLIQDEHAFDLFARTIVQAQAINAMDKKNNLIADQLIKFAAELVTQNHLGEKFAERFVRTVNQEIENINQHVTVNSQKVTLSNIIQSLKQYSGVDSEHVLLKALEYAAHMQGFTPVRYEAMRGAMSPDQDTRERAINRIDSGIANGGEESMETKRAFRKMVVTPDDRQTASTILTSLNVVNALNPKPGTNPTFELLRFVDSTITVHTTAEELTNITNFYRTVLRDARSVRDLTKKSPHDLSQLQTQLQSKPTLTAEEQRQLDILNAVVVRDVNGHALLRETQDRLDVIKEKTKALAKEANAMRLAAENRLQLMEFNVARPLTTLISNRNTVFSDPEMHKKPDEMQRTFRSQVTQQVRQTNIDPLKETNEPIYDALEALKDVSPDDIGAFQAAIQDLETAIDDSKTSGKDKYLSLSQKQWLNDLTTIGLYGGGARGNTETDMMLDFLRSGSQEEIRRWLDSQPNNSAIEKLLTRDLNAATRAERESIRELVTLLTSNRLIGLTQRRGFLPFVVTTLEGLTAKSRKNNAEMQKLETVITSFYKNMAEQLQGGQISTNDLDQFFRLQALVLSTTVTDGAAELDNTKTHLAKLLDDLANREVRGKSKDDAKKIRDEINAQKTAIQNVTTYTDLETAVTTLKTSLIALKDSQNSPILDPLTSNAILTIDRMAPHITELKNRSDKSGYLNSLAGKISGNFATALTTEETDMLVELVENTPLQAQLKAQMAANGNVHAYLELLRAIDDGVANRPPANGVIQSAVNPKELTIGTDTPKMSKELRKDLELFRKYPALFTHFKAGNQQEQFFTELENAINDIKTNNRPSKANEQITRLFGLLNLSPSMLKQQLTTFTGEITVDSLQLTNPGSPLAPYATITGNETRLVSDLANPKRLGLTKEDALLDPSGRLKLKYRHNEPEARRQLETILAQPPYGLTAPALSLAAKALYDELKRIDGAADRRLAALNTIRESVRASTAISAQSSDAMTLSLNAMTRQIDNRPASLLKRMLQSAEKAKNYALKGPEYLSNYETQVNNMVYLLENMKDELIAKGITEDEYNKFAEAASKGRTEKLKAVMTLLQKAIGNQSAFSPQDKNTLKQAIKLVATAQLNDVVTGRVKPEDADWSRLMETIKVVSEESDPLNPVAQITIAHIEQGEVYNRFWKLTEGKWDIRLMSGIFNVRKNPAGQTVHSNPAIQARAAKLLEEQPGIMQDIMKHYGNQANTDPGKLDKLANIANFFIENSNLPEDLMLDTLISSLTNGVTDPAILNSVTHDLWTKIDIIKNNSTPPLSQDHLNTLAYIYSRLAPASPLLPSFNAYMASIGIAAPGNPGALDTLLTVPVGLVTPTTTKETYETHIKLTQLLSANKPNGTPKTTTELQQDMQDVRAFLKNRIIRNGDTANLVRFLPEIMANKAGRDMVHQLIQTDKATRDSLADMVGNSNLGNLVNITAIPMRTLQQLWEIPSLRASLQQYRFDKDDLLYLRMRDDIAKGILNPDEALTRDQDRLINVLKLAEDNHTIDSFKPFLKRNAGITIDVFANRMQDHDGIMETASLARHLDYETMTGLLTQTIDDISTGGAPNKAELLTELLKQTVAHPDFLVGSPEGSRTIQIGKLMTYLQGLASGNPPRIPRNNELLEALTEVLKSPSSTPGHVKKTAFKGLDVNGTKLDENQSRIIYWKLRDAGVINELGQTVGDVDAAVAAMGPVFINATNDLGIPVNPPANPVTVNAQLKEDIIRQLKGVAVPLPGVPQDVRRALLDQMIIAGKTGGKIENPITASKIATPAELKSYLAGIKTPSPLLAEQIDYFLNQPANINSHSLDMQKLLLTMSKNQPAMFDELMHNDAIKNTLVNTVFNVPANTKATETKELEALFRTRGPVRSGAPNIQFADDMLAALKRNDTGTLEDWNKLLSDPQTRRYFMQKLSREDITWNSSIAQTLMQTQNGQVIMDRLFSELTEPEELVHRQTIVDSLYSDFIQNSPEERSQYLERMNWLLQHNFQSSIPDFGFLSKDNNIDRNLSANIRKSLQTSFEGKPAVLDSLGRVAVPLTQTTVDRIKTQLKKEGLNQDQIDFVLKQLQAAETMEPSAKHIKMVNLFAAKFPLDTSRTAKEALKRQKDKMTVFIDEIKNSGLSTTVQAQLLKAIMIRNQGKYDLDVLERVGMDNHELHSELLRFSMTRYPQLYTPNHHHFEYLNQALADDLMTTGGQLLKDLSSHFDLETHKEQNLNISVALRTGMSRSFQTYGMKTAMSGKIRANLSVLAREAAIEDNKNLLNILTDTVHRRQRELSWVTGGWYSGTAIDLGNTITPDTLGGKDLTPAQKKMLAQYLVDIKAITENTEGSYSVSGSRDFDAEPVTLAQVLDSPMFASLTIDQKANLEKTVNATLAAPRRFIRNVTERSHALTFDKRFYQSSDETDKSAYSRSRMMSRLQNTPGTENLQQMVLDEWDKASTAPMPWDRDPVRQRNQSGAIKAKREHALKSGVFNTTLPSLTKLLLDTDPNNKTRERVMKMIFDKPKDITVEKYQSYFEDGRFSIFRPHREAGKRVFLSRPQLNDQSRLIKKGVDVTRFMLEKIGEGAVSGTQKQEYLDTLHAIKKRSPEIFKAAFEQMAPDFQTRLRPDIHP